MIERKLVLVTNNFPDQVGDAPFVEKEIEQLAAAFDQVTIFSFLPPTGPLAQLPPGVTYGGSLQQSSRWPAVAEALRPRTMRRIIRALWRERGSGDSLRTIGNAVTGVRFARAMKIRDTFDSRTTLYCFWATRGALALPFVNVRGLKAVRAHRYDLYEMGNHRPLRHAIFASADRILPISEHGAAYLIEAFPQHATKITVSRLGSQGFGLGPGPGSNPDSVWHVVSCSSLASVKRVPLLLQSLRLLARTHPVKWTHFGGDGADLAALAQQAEGVTSDRFQIDLRGHVQNAEVMDFFRSVPVDVFANVSSSEGVPVSIMEALSFGIPVAATAVGGTREIVGQELNSGILLSKNPSPEEVAQALAQICDNRDQWTPQLVWERMSDAKKNAAHAVRLLTTVPSRGRAMVATRIHLPEPAAASFRLSAVEKALVRQGFEVTALTTTYPPAGDASASDPAGVDVSRWPVLRGADGYLRGYLPYMSFDVPLFIRTILARRPKIILVEPPPTTGVIVRLAAGLRRVPYVWYAADVWSDATAIAGSPRPVVAALRMMERFALKGAAGVIAVSEGVAERARDLGGADVVVVPGGIDTETYTPQAQPLSDEEKAEYGMTGPYLLYAGTASEWQGAVIFARAFAKVRRAHPEAQLVFVGQGSEWGELERLAAKAPGSIMVHPTTDSETVARLLVGAKAALVSIVPGQGYDFAYPTKVLAALATGTPVVFAGRGPAAEDLRSQDLGWVARHSEEGVASAMETALETPNSDQATQRRSLWVQQNRSLRAAGKAAAKYMITKARA